MKIKIPGKSKKKLTAMLGLGPNNASIRKIGNKIAALYGEAPIVPGGNLSSHRCHNLIADYCDKHKIDYRITRLYKSPNVVRLQPQRSINPKSDAFLLCGRDSHQARN